MKIISLIACVLFLGSCATAPTPAFQIGDDSAATARKPATTGDLSGDYLGEGLFSKRKDGIKRPAMRLYLERAEGEADSYYGVLYEYSDLLKMTLPYLATQKAPKLNDVIGYLNRIGSRITAFKAVPGAGGAYELHNLQASNGRITPEKAVMYTMTLDRTKPGFNAVITGNGDGNVVFPGNSAKTSIIGSIAEALTLSQYEMAKISYKLGHLASSWRGNWDDLQGSYLSEYGRFHDGVEELYMENGKRKTKFMLTKSTKAKYFTNPKSATIVGDYYMTEPIPKMYVLVPTHKGAPTASDKEMTNRIGLFLDVFDGSAPEAGSHMVTELAFASTSDSEDFMMYYEHPNHLKNVGVDQAPTSDPTK